MKKFFSVMLLVISIVLSKTSIGQIYISLDGIDGESQFRDFPNSTLLQSVSWGGANQSSISLAGGGVSSGRVSIGDFHIMKPRGAASGPIQMALYAGKKIAKAEIRFYTAAQPTAYLTIILEDVMITSWQISGSESEKPSESISLIASRFKTEEMIKNAAGVAKRVTTGWDVARNIVISW